MSETRQETLARFDSRCETCGAGPDTGLELRKLHVHHRNGDHADDRPENRAVLCATCHLRHHKRDPRKALAPPMSFRVTSKGNQLLRQFSQELGVNRTDVVELALRALAKRHGLEHEEWIPR